MTLEKFAAALDAWGAKSWEGDGAAIKQALCDVTPPGLKLWPNGNATSLKVTDAGSLTEGVALFYLNPPGKRTRDPERVRLAWAAVVALGAAVTPQPERPRVEVYRVDDGRAVEFYPLDLGVPVLNARGLAKNVAARLEAVDGTPYGVRVIGAPDEIEPGEFGRCIEAGYRVSDFSGAHGASFQAETPDGDPVSPDYFETERAAWEACDRHRIFGAEGVTTEKGA